MGKYKAFEQLIETMNLRGYNYKSSLESTLKNLKKRQNGEEFSLAEHISTLVFALLSNQRPWKAIGDNAETIKSIFHYFDASYLKTVDPNLLTDAIRNIHCGNRQIAKQMDSLKDNVETLEKIAKEHGSIDAYYNSKNALELVHELSAGRYKMKQMGAPLVSEYLKGVGIDVIKPDVHVCRILGRLGYSKNTPAKLTEAYSICQDIAKEYSITCTEVDAVLWQYCADGQFELCTSSPRCADCLVQSCTQKNTGTQCNPIIRKEPIEHITLTNMCMVYDDKGNVLVENKIVGSHPGLIFPGGHVEHHEPIVDSMIREIKEETGLAISNLQLCGIKDWIEDNGSRYMVFLYKTNEFKGTLQSSSEGKVYWMPLEELKKKEMLWHLDKMLEIFLTDKYSELYFDKKSNSLEPTLK